MMIMIMFYDVPQIQWLEQHLFQLRRRVIHHLHVCDMM